MARKLARRHTGYIAGSVAMKEELAPIIGDKNMIQELPEALNKVLEAQRAWQ